MPASDGKLAPGLQDDCDLLADAFEQLNFWTLKAVGVLAGQFEYTKQAAANLQRKGDHVCAVWLLVVPENGLLFTRRAAHSFRGGDLGKERAILRRGHLPQIAHQPQLGLRSQLLGNRGGDQLVLFDSGLGSSEAIAQIQDPFPGLGDPDLESRCSNLRLPVFGHGDTLPRWGTNSY